MMMAGKKVADRSKVVACSTKEVSCKRKVVEVDSNVSAPSREKKAGKKVADRSKVVACSTKVVACKRKVVADDSNVSAPSMEKAAKRSKNMSCRSKVVTVADKSKAVEEKSKGFRGRKKSAGKTRVYTDLTRVLADGTKYFINGCKELPCGARYLPNGIRLKKHETGKNDPRFFYSKDILRLEDPDDNNVRSKLEIDQPIGKESTVCLPEALRPGYKPKPLCSLKEYLARNFTVPKEVLDFPENQQKIIDSNKPLEVKLEELNKLDEKRRLSLKKKIKEKPCAKRRKSKALPLSPAANPGLRREDIVCKQPYVYGRYGQRASKNPYLFPTYFGEGEGDDIFEDDPRFNKK